jgi:putative membrane protein
MDGWAGGWMWLWGTFMMVGVLIAVVWLVRSVTTGRPTSPTADNGTERARAILAERYARGELTTEEYRERLEHLV